MTGAAAPDAARFLSRWAQDAAPARPQRPGPAPPASRPARPALGDGEAPTLLPDASRCSAPPRAAPLRTGAARRALERELCSAWGPGTGKQPRSSVYSKCFRNLKNRLSNAIIKLSVNLCNKIHQQRRWVI